MLVIQMLMVIMQVKIMNMALTIQVKMQPVLKNMA